MVVFVLLLVCMILSLLYLLTDVFLKSAYHAEKTSSTPVLRTSIFQFTMMKYFHITFPISQFVQVLLLMLISLLIPHHLKHYLNLTLLICLLPIILLGFAFIEKDITIELSSLRPAYSSQFFKMAIIHLSQIILIGIILFEAMASL